MNRIFYRINNFLILFILGFIGFLALARQNTAHSELNLFDKYFVSQAAVTPSPTPSGPNSLTVINKRADVTIKGAPFKVDFVSDGNSDDATDEQKSKFYGKPPQLQPIPIPLEFQIAQDANGKQQAYVEMVGEIVYGAINSPTAPTSATCNEADANDPAKRNDDQCLYFVKTANVYAHALKNRVLKNNAGAIEQKQGANIIDIFKNIINTLFNTNGGLPVSGIPDQGRTAIGTISFWADDEIQQLAPVNTKAIFDAEVGVTSQAVIRDTDYFLSDVSNTIMIEYPTKLNIYNSKVIGSGNITDAWTKPDGAYTTQTPIERLISNWFDESDKQPQYQRKISAHAPLRELDETTKFSASYSFCKGLDTEGLNILSGLDPNAVPNPFGTGPGGKTAPSYYSCSPIPGTQIYPCGESDQHRWWSNFEARSKQEKQCLTGVSMYQPEKTTACAEYLGKNPGSGCQEFSVSEDKLHFSMVQSTIPIGFGAFFLNGNLNNMTPNVKGPFLNYLSPYFCAKLNIAYEVKKGKSYIYDVGGRGETSFNSDKGVNDSAKINNQYCVVGSLLSNFSWVLSQQQNNTGTDNMGKINLDRDTLTCDKKEVALFGASKVEANIQTPQEKLLYITEDNARGKLDSEDVLLNWDYQPYNLNYIINDPIVKNLPFFKYRDWDLKVVVNPNTKTPEYVLFVTQPKEKDAKKSMVFCRLFLDVPVGTQKGWCKLVADGEWILPGKTTMTTVDGVDVLTTVYYDEVEDKDTDDERPKHLKYRYIVVNDKDNINSDSTIITDKKELSEYAQYDVVQLRNGKTGIALSEYVRGGGLTSIRFMQLDAATYLHRAYLTVYGEGSTVNPQDQNFKTLMDRQRAELVAEKPLTLSGNLCEIRNFCALLDTKQGWPNVRIAYDNYSNPSDPGYSENLFVVTAVGGLGAIYNLGSMANGSAVQQIMIFGYQKTSFAFAQDRDYLSIVKYNALEKSFNMFFKSSAFYLKVVAPTDYNDTDLKGNLIKNTPTDPNCSSNCEMATFSEAVNRSCKDPSCMVSLQYEFNPQNFKHDCSDYFGSGACGYAPLSELGKPEVFDFTIRGGKVYSYYTYKKLSKTILASPDMLWSYNGVYSKMGDGNEYSNAYVPVTEGESGKATISKVVPIRFFNRANGGLKAGKSESEKTELVDHNGNVVENPYVMQPSKADCLRNFDDNVTGIDLYFKQTGIEKVILNPVKLPPSQQSSNGGMTNANSGDYCEESWCVHDDFKLVGNENFMKGKVDLQTEINVITEFATRERPGYGDYRPSVTQMCTAAAEYGIPCALLAGIWHQETSMSLADLAGHFGCGLSSYAHDFTTQLNCAICTIKNWSDRYDQAGGNMTYGPYKGALYTPNNGKSEKESMGICKPATRFSAIFQKYTPNDKRINIDNACNLGQVMRSDHDQYCSGDGYSSKKLAELGLTMDQALQGLAPWPKGETTGSTRNNMRNVIDALNAALPPALQMKTDTSCYPSPTTPGSNDSIDPTASNAEVLKNYDIDQQHVGKVVLDFTNWSTNAEAAHALMAIDGQVLWTTDKDGNKVWLSQGMRKLQVIEPGQTYDFNTMVLGGDSYFAQQKYADQFLDNRAEYARANGYLLSKGCSLPGCGWCELATAVAKAARKANYLKNPNQRNHQDGANGRDYWTGDIKYAEHTDIPGPDIFNAIAPRAEDHLPSQPDWVQSFQAIGSDGKPVTIRRSNEYVGQFIPGSSMSVFNSTDKTMFVQVVQPDRNTKKFEFQVFFGTKKTTAPQPSSQTKTNSVPVAMHADVVKKYYD